MELFTCALEALIKAEVSAMAMPLVSHLENGSLKFSHLIRRQVVCFPPLLFQLQEHSTAVLTPNLVVWCHPDLKGGLDSQACCKVLLTIVCWVDKLVLSESTKT